MNSLWRYAEVLPLPAPSISLGEGRTPLVELGDGVSAKLDYLMPTLSFKDRGAVLLAELALRLGPREVVADSSGNAGTAIAAYCARAGLPCTVYVPAGTSAKKLEQIGAHGARVHVVDGDREAAAQAARERADEPEVFYASHVFNPFFLHGTKTYVHELWEDLGGRLPEVLVLPVGNGTLLLGAALAVRRAVHVRPDRAAARTVRGAGGGGRPTGPRMAGGRRRPGGRHGHGPHVRGGHRDPRPPRARQILRAVRDSGGRFLTVTEDQIREAQRDLASRGLYVETTGVVSWAAVREEELGARGAVVPLCGAGLKTGLAGTGPSGG